MMLPKVQEGVPDPNSLSAPQIFLSAATDAVDAALITKEVAVHKFTSDLGIPLGEVAAIGDSTNDLPFLTIPGLGLAGAPLNAQARVKEALASCQRGHVSRGEFLEGFEEFYTACTEAGIKYIFADKDGVLTGKEAPRVCNRLRHLLERMGDAGRPFIVILTGSSKEQNLIFMREYGLDHGLDSNPRIRENPYVIHAENGAVQINVLTGDSRERLDWLDSGLLAILQSRFRELLVNRLATKVLPPFNLEWSSEHSNQHSRLYMPPKKTMITCNIPRSHHMLPDYRRSAESDRLRRAILEETAATARQLGLSYRVL